MQTFVLLNMHPYSKGGLRNFSLNMTVTYPCMHLAQMHKSGLEIAQVLLSYINVLLVSC